MKNFIRRVAVLELLIFVIIIIVQSNIIRAEEVYKVNFQKINTKDGLSNKNITKIYQDSRGYIWIGTVNGLNRYNGHNIKVYNNDIGNENGLSFSYITDIVEDDYGNIWIGTKGGLNILDVKKDEIVTVSNRKDNENGNSHLKITALYKDSSGNMWIGTEEGLNVYDIKTGNFNEYTTEGEEGKKLTNNYITVIKEDDKGNVWIGTKRGLNIFMKETNTIDINLHKVSKNICDIENFDGEYTLILTEDGIGKSKYNEYDIFYKYTEDEEVKVNINDIMIDNNNDIWYGTTDGVSKYNRKKYKKEDYRASVYEESAISSNYVTCLFEDKNGVIWIGTDNGVNVIGTNQEFNLLGIEYLKSEKLQDISVTTILEDSDNDYWIGSKYSGIRYINEQDVISYLHKEDGILSNNIKSLTEVNKGKILVATDEGFNIIDKYTGKIESFRTDELYNVNIVHKDKNEDIVWIGMEDGLVSYSLSRNEFIKYKSNFKEKGISDISIIDIYQDPNYEDILWLGGESSVGLIKFNKNTGIEKIYNYQMKDDSISYGSINCMQGDDDGYIWIGTNVGLVKFNTFEDTIYIYTEKDGLIDDYIYSLLLDDDGNVWATTDKGISKFVVDTNKFNNYIEGREIFTGGFNVGVAHKREDGLMFLGGTKGLLFFNPKDIIEQSYENNNVVIEDIIVNNEERYSTEDNIELEYNKNNIEISFFTPDYKSLGSIKYDYILEGVDKDWTYGSIENSAKYTLLSPGKYKFKVRAIDTSGNVSNETIVNIVIKRPLWKTPFAYTIYITIFIIISIWIWNYVKILDQLVKKRTLELNNQLEYNDKLYKEIIKNEKFKNAYFVNLSHELRTPLNVILSTVQLVNLLNRDKKMLKEKSSQYVKIIENNSNMLLKIIDDIVDTSKIEAGHYKINKEYADIVYVVEEIALSMSKFIEEKGIEFTIDPEIEEKIMYFDITEIERCIINLLSNASKFTPEGGKINLYIKDKGDKVEIIVEDTGIGISEEDKEFIFGRFSQVEGAEIMKCSSSGIGLTLVKNIVELHEGSIILESEVDKGSRFIISLPVQ